MSYELIALDMDGTLLNESKQISDRNKQAIKSAREQGKSVVIATGRPLVGVRRVLQELSMDSHDDYVISFNGALVQNVKSGEIIFSRPLSHKDYSDLYKLSRNYDVHIHALTDTYVTTPVANEYTKVEADINMIETVICDVENLPKDETIVKVMMVDAPEKLDVVEKLLPHEIREKYTIVRSAEIFLEFLDKTVDKGVGVNAVASLKNISSEKVICVGDAGNDLAMIEYAGLGVAMGNAYDYVKTIADYVTDTNEKDGVAKVIEKFMLRKAV